MISLLKMSDHQKHCGIKKIIITKLQTKRSFLLSSSTALVDLMSTKLVPICSTRKHVGDVLVGGDRMHDEDWFCLEAKGAVLSLVLVSAFFLIAIFLSDLVKCQCIGLWWYSFTFSLLLECWCLETVILGNCGSGGISDWTCAPTLCAAATCSAFRNPWYSGDICNN